MTYLIDYLRIIKRRLWQYPSCQWQRNCLMGEATMITLLPLLPVPIRRTARLPCASECLGVEPQYGELRHNHIKSRSITD